MATRKKNVIDAHNKEYSHWGYIFEALRTTAQIKGFPISEYTTSDEKFLDFIIPYSFSRSESGDPIYDDKTYTGEKHNYTKIRDKSYGVNFTVESWFICSALFKTPDTNGCYRDESKTKKIWTSQFFKNGDNQLSDNNVGELFPLIRTNPDTFETFIDTLSDNFYYELPKVPKHILQNYSGDLKTQIDKVKRIGEKLSSCKSEDKVRLQSDFSQEFLRFFRILFDTVTELREEEIAKDKAKKKAGSNNTIDDIMTDHFTLSRVFCQDPELPCNDVIANEFYINPVYYNNKVLCGIERRLLYSFKTRNRNSAVQDWAFEHDSAAKKLPPFEPRKLRTTKVFEETLLPVFDQKTGKVSTKKDTVEIEVIQEDTSRNSNAVVILFDCPNEDDYCSEEHTAFPAFGKIGEQLNSSMQSILNSIDDDSFLALGEGDVDVILMTAIQFRCFFSENSSPNSIFSALWEKSTLRDSFRKRMEIILSSYEEVLFLNCCSENNAETVKKEMDTVLNSCDNFEYHKGSHPLTWK